MRAVITVLGKDNVGILAKVSNVCADAGANIIEVTQSVLQEMFAMIMFVEIGDIPADGSDLCQDGIRSNRFIAESIADLPV